MEGKGSEFSPLEVLEMLEIWRKIGKNDDLGVAFASSCSSLRRKLRELSPKSFSQGWMNDWPKRVQLG
jgi:hypothetical protein